MLLLGKGEGDVRMVSGRFFCTATLFIMSVLGYMDAGVFSFVGRPSREISQSRAPSPNVMIRQDPHRASP